MSMNSAFVQWISRRFPENLNPVFVKEMRQILHSGIPQSLILIEGGKFPDPLGRKE